MLIPLFYEDPPILHAPLLFQISATPHTSQSPPTSNLTLLSVFLFLWLNGWSRHIWCAIIRNENMDPQMSSLVILVPEGLWCEFCATRRQVYWGLTHAVFTGSLIWYHTHTQTNTQHTRGPVDRHTHIDIYLHRLLFAHSSYLYYIKWYQKSHSLISKIYFPQCLFFSKIIHF